MQDEPVDHHRRSAGRVRLVAAALVPPAVFLALAACVWVSGRGIPRAANDQNVYHLKAIRQFAAQWPRPDFRDYPSASTPGYLLALALVDRFVTGNEIALRAAGASFTVGMLATLGWLLARRARRTPDAVALCLPLVTSLYTFSSGAYLLPDNAAWWGVVLALALALDERRRWGARTTVAAGALLLALVLVRQVHLWAAGLFVAAAWLGGCDRLLPPAAQPVAPDDTMLARSRRAVWMIVACVPAVVAVAWFMRLWHGTMPPSIATEIYLGWKAPEAGIRLTGPNWAVPATILAVAGALGPFYVGFLMPAVRARRVRPTWILTGAGVGFLLAVLPHTSYEYGTRSSGLWNVVRKLPTMAERSPLILGLAALGGATLAAWLQALPRRAAWILAAAFLGYAASQVPNPSAFQRYYEPFVLIAFALAAVHVSSASDVSDVSGEPPRPSLPPPPRGAWVGPVLAAVLLGAVTALSFG
jgi:hypothetical protein